MKRKLIYVVGIAIILAFIPGATNPWLKYHNIYYDPVNGNDSNSCTVIGAPCLTWGEILRRVGGPSPMMISDGFPVTFHILSSPIGHDGPINFIPWTPTNALVSFVGTMTQVGSNCTLSAVTNRNTSSSVGTLPTITATCPTTAGQFIQNTTHTSNAFVKSWSAGSGTITQPLTPCDVTTNTCARTEVNNWAIGDTISVWTMPSVQFDTAGEQNSALGSGAIGFEHISFHGAGNTFVGPYVSLWENKQDANANVQIYSPLGEVLNYYQPLSGGLIFHAAYAASPNALFHLLVPGVEGGIFQNGSDIESANFDLGIDLEYDVATSGTYGDVYLGAPGPNGEGIFVQASNLNEINGGASGLIWGPGAFNMGPGATLAYQATTSTSVFKNGTVAAGGRGYAVWPGTAKNAGVTQALWCATNTGGTTSVATNCGITGVASNFELAFGSGGCAGNCFAPGGFGLVAFTQ